MFFFFPANDECAAWNKARRSNKGSVVLNPRGVCGDGSLIRSALRRFISAAALSVCSISPEELEGSATPRWINGLFPLNYESTVLPFFFPPTQSVIASVEQRIAEEAVWLFIRCWLTAGVRGEATRVCLISANVASFHTLCRVFSHPARSQSVVTLLSVTFVNECLFASGLRIMWMPGAVLTPRVEDSSVESLSWDSWGGGRGGRSVGTAWEERFVTAPHRNNSSLAILSPHTHHDSALRDTHLHRRDIA